MSHPSVVTLDKKSAPRTLFAGDMLVEVDLPPGTRCIYPKPPLASLKDPDAAIRYALNHPLNSEPLHAKLRPGLKVVFMSGFTADVIGAGGVLDPNVNFVQKPFSKRELGLEIRKALDGKTAGASG